MLSKLLKTEAGRKQIAQAMITPIRCGGLDYINGKPYYRIGGKLVTPKQMALMSTMPVVDDVLQIFNKKTIY
jgi:hypothetical protein